MPVEPRSSPRGPYVVHPRGCGEQALNPDPEPNANRFIPAGAGNSYARCETCCHATVHPRGCGEQDNCSLNLHRGIGSSPRVRGTGEPRWFSVWMRRFIPAGAGNSAPVQASRSKSPVHPRGCGEQDVPVVTFLRGCGSSPRVRGTGPVVFRLRGRSPVHPRGCGEQIPRNPGPALSCGSSPRVRGTERFIRILKNAIRFIPAGAGNSALKNEAPEISAVHPRGCGEQDNFIAIAMAEAGSSPRVRGTDAPQICTGQLNRFIPAGAGNRTNCGLPA